MKFALCALLIGVGSCSMQAMQEMNKIEARIGMLKKTDYNDPHEKMEEICSISLDCFKLVNEAKTARESNIESQLDKTMLTTVLHLLWIGLSSHKMVDLYDNTVGDESGENADPVQFFKILQNKARKKKLFKTKQ